MTHENLFAYTAPGCEFPGYLSINRLPSGDVSISLRSAPKVIEDSIFICGYASDKGKPGRCTPGDENCNNYCNLAPEKGPMQPRAKSCRQVVEGALVELLIPKDEWRSASEVSPLFGDSND